MPWCDECARFYDERQLGPDGTCTHCGAVITRPAEAEGGDKAEEDEGGRVPWHFWLLAAALAIYLGFRLIQGISWAADKL
jgi:hypothetical protein